MGLHSDQSLVVPDPWREPWALNVIWCLHDCKFENGSTLFIPGSNKWVNRSEVPDNAIDMLQPFEAKAGSIIVMEGRVRTTSTTWGLRTNIMFPDMAHLRRQHHQGSRSVTFGSANAPKKPTRFVSS